MPKTILALKRYWVRAKDLLLIFLFLSAVGCGAGSDPVPLRSVTDRTNSRPSENLDKTFVPGEFWDLSELAKEAGLCSGLALDSLAWRQDILPAHEVVALLLALNITGSFEGRFGWQNLSNNFDDQGVSLGLLNQNLGSGTLQPLLIAAHERDALSLGVVLGDERHGPLLDMLKRWLTAMNTSGSLQLLQLPRPPVSRLDADAELNPFFFLLTTPNRESVAWATQNLYSDGRHEWVPEWKESLTELAIIPAYRIGQLEAALQLHQSARAYQTRLGFSSLRSYLLFFDIVVQNGGLNDQEINSFVTFRRKQKKASERTLLKRLVEIRLGRVLKRWRADVSSRKMAIVTGSGIVHGAARDFEQEFCMGLEGARWF